ncbi:unnamed protein product [Nippostrongylus brasiliensis]|uniref:Fatty-acid amide hydrolase 2 (inferred by orthology to a human protein) n=1 Tax=Nippostrongylus brasiliensis TaxID=27835 RepID=A0A0N4YN94_NIPBR|nr:unnamed protein product [Nippostrongylus brasiliensis]
MGVGYDFVTLVIHAYFAFIHVVFSTINLFVKKQHVPAPSDDLVMLSATSAVEKIKERKIRPSQLVEAYIHRIEQLIQRRPLYGVPFSCKDSMEVKGQIVTIGMECRKDYRCERTATVIQRMRNAGGILIAITNVPELCSWVESTNVVYGRSNNPYDLRRIVGGSSGGEGALISAAGTPVGVGSDVGGSIRIPCFVNGIFGLMPTPDVIPLEGNVPEALCYKRQMLRDGPMCRYMEDLPLLYKVWHTPTILAGENFADLRIDEPVDFYRCRIFYLTGIPNPMIEPVGDQMFETLMNAVSHFEKKFDLEGVGLDLPLAAQHFSFYSASLEGNISTRKKLMSLKGDAGEIKLWSEFLNWLMGKSKHRFAMIMIAAMEALGGSASPESKAEVPSNIFFSIFIIESRMCTQSLRVRDRLKRQIVETLGDSGIMFFPS